MCMNKDIRRTAGFSAGVFLQGFKPRLQKGCVSPIFLKTSNLFPTPSNRAVAGSGRSVVLSMTTCSPVSEDLSKAHITSSTWYAKVPFARCMRPERIADTISITPIIRALFGKRISSSSQLPPAGQTGTGPPNPFGSGTFIEPVSP